MWQGWRTWLAWFLGVLSNGRLAAPWFPDVLFVGGAPPERRLVALTIDDSPTENTAAILSVLREYGAHATFFVLGSELQGIDNRPRWAASVKTLADEGHEFGNHTMYDRASIRLNLAQLGQELSITTERIRRIGGFAATPRWFRPGSGFFTPGMVRLAEGLGMKTALGSLYPHDPICRDPEANAAFILKRVQPNDILITHDRPWAVPMLRILLKGLKEEGFTVVTLSTLEHYRGSGSLNRFASSDSDSESD